MCWRSLIKVTDRCASYLLDRPIEYCSVTRVPGFQIVVWNQCSLSQVFAHLPTPTLLAARSTAAAPSRPYRFSRKRETARSLKSNRTLILIPMFVVFYFPRRYRWYFFFPCDLLRDLRNGKIYIYIQAGVLIPLWRTTPRLVRSTKFYLNITLF